jgi:hypothetical protein
VTANPRAADLPVGSVVADDRSRIAWYATGRPGEYDDRWDATGSSVTSPDSSIDWALRHGATVLRVGDGSGEG